MDINKREFLADHKTRAKARRKQANAKLMRRVHGLCVTCGEPAMEGRRTCGTCTVANRIRSYDPTCGSRMHGVVIPPRDPDDC